MTCSRGMWDRRQKGGRHSGGILPRVLHDAGRREGNADGHGIKQVQQQQQQSARCEAVQ